MSGQLAELFVAQALARLDYVVSKPWLTQCEYDLVIERDGKFHSVQVKKATWSKAGNHSYLQARLSRDKRRLVSEVDLFAFTDNQDVWLVDTKELIGLTSVCLMATTNEYKPKASYDPDNWLL